MAADFNTGVLTTKGLALLAKWQAGTCTPTITRAVAGSGSYSSGESLVNRTSLKSQKLSVGISKKTITNSSTLVLRFIISNESLSAGFSLTEVGVYATDPDEGEILYSMAVTSDASNADYIPAYNGTYPTSVVFNYQIEVANADTVTITGGTGAYAAADDFNALQDDVDALEEQANDSELAVQILAQRVMKLGEQIEDDESGNASNFEELDAAKEDAHEVGTATLTNSNASPLFNSTVLSPVTVSLATKRSSVDYLVNTQILEYEGGRPGAIEITDRLTNGFKVAFTGSATSATFAWEIVPGLS